MSATRTPSQIGRASRTKGAQFERAIARAIQPWYPGAKRSRDNGHRAGGSVSPDSGDIAETGPELFWSLKNNLAGDTDSASTVGTWFAECQTKAAALHRVGVLAQKRRGCFDPLSSWCWLRLADVAHMAGYVAEPLDEVLASAPVRLCLRDALALFAHDGLTLANPGTELPHPSGRPDPPKDTREGLSARPPATASSLTAIASHIGAPHAQT